MSRKRQWGEDSTTKIDLSGGASITVSFLGNLFTLEPAERQLMSDLSAVLQSYQDSKASGQAKAAALK
ncbi:MAG TPA: hypothetical protein VE030_11350 [Burkholderiales bacterium]|nr:hypothetical protein [Burkholderiales bacterium]